jgi:predicted enzyme related to lactoylglutathione lyase
MASRFTELCIDCADPRRLAAFWAAVLDWRMDEDDDEDYVEVVDPDHATPILLFARVPEGKSVKNRLHIDVSPRDREQAEEVERLLGLGATHADVGQGDDVSWVVLADPEGNEFCVLAGRKP